MVGRIGSMHTCDFSRIMTLPERSSIFGLSANPRFVAVLLRLGDLCDVDNGRFNLMMMKTFGQLPASSLVHYYKHWTITNLYISESKILMEADVSFQEIGKRLQADPDSKIDPKSFCHQVIFQHQSWFDMLESELRDIQLHSAELFPETVDQGLPVFQYRILLDGKPCQYSSENLRFQFPREKVFELIEGYSLYNEPCTFMRELVQNSLDAMKIQLWRDLKDGLWRGSLLEEKRDNLSDLDPFDLSEEVYDYYHIDIAIRPHKTQPGKSEITFQDNGIGITLETLQNRILRVGTSWSERPEFKAELKDR